MPRVLGFAGNQAVVIHTHTRRRQEARTRMDVCYIRSALFTALDPAKVGVLITGRMPISSPTWNVVSPSYLERSDIRTSEGYTCSRVQAS